MQLPSLEQIRAARELVYRHMPPTPQYSWPLLNQRLGTEVWVKHENHTPVGAFKIRGALVYLSELIKQQPRPGCVVAATRGNFGQGIAMAARLYGVKTIIVVPHGNSPEKNRAMQAQGAILDEHGEDFQAAFQFARQMAQERGAVFVESFHEWLVRGTATYALEFFEGAPPLDVIYVPIGLGSSIAGVAAVRNALNLKTKIIGVVSSESPSYARSFHERCVVEEPARTKIADGLACRVPNADAVEAIIANVDHIVEVSDAEVMDAMRACYEDTHNVAEGAGAAALAGAIKERYKERIAGKRVGIVLTGGNVDRDVYAVVLDNSLRGAAREVTTR
jgi:threonine dehydratase